MTTDRKRKIQALLKGIETGDPAAVNVVSRQRYIQHNPSTAEGGEGLADLFARLAKTSPRVNIVRIFADGDFVFGHTEYDFSHSRVGFEVFRFEGEYTVEHWDNIQTRRGPNPSGYSMVDGTTDVCDLDKTESNRKLVSDFVRTVVIARQLEQLHDYIAPNYTEHNPTMARDVAALKRALVATDAGSQPVIQYQHLHRVLAEGNFVLTVSEGYRHGQHTSFYDLFRVADGLIVEHWDTIETIPPPSEWKNNNGKF